MKKLTDNELLNLLGGDNVVTEEDYCDKLDFIITHNWDKMSKEEKDGAIHAWNEHCLG
ncbi:MAG: hypothetical protein K2G13_05085 [Muribaculaceae bacterium]|nr:hypothetical protein [Muribaculaceae bacterium]